YCRPWKRRPHARARRQPEHRALAQPAAARRHGPRRAPAPARRRPRRRRADRARSTRDRPAAGDDRADSAVARRSQVVSRSSAPGRRAAPARSRPGRTGPVAATSRLALAAFFVASGVNHFVSPRFYRAIVPPSLRDRATLVVDVSGVAEVLGGVGVLLPRTRRASGGGLIALLVAVFPANLYMAREPE